MIDKKGGVGDEILLKDIGHYALWGDDLFTGNVANWSNRVYR